MNIKLHNLNCLFKLIYRGIQNSLSNVFKKSNDEEQNKRVNTAFNA